MLSMFTLARSPSLSFLAHSLFCPSYIFGASFLPPSPCRSMRQRGEASKEHANGRTDGDSIIFRTQHTHTRTSRM
ncbi:hypothetical protein B0O80DRAFT_445421 [Mortierella sp. GBAus27b]|nr:hypothetical protein B0O80DRAFT_445421 [Mortierella sp. GBAus27b]